MKIKLANSIEKTRRNLIFGVSVILITMPLHSEAALAKFRIKNLYENDPNIVIVTQPGDESRVKLIPKRDSDPVGYNEESFEYTLDTPDVHVLFDMPYHDFRYSVRKYESFAKYKEIATGNFRVRIVNEGLGVYRWTCQYFEMKNSKVNCDWKNNGEHTGKVVAIITP